MDEEKQKPKVSQIPLLKDVVFDASRKPGVQTSHRKKTVASQNEHGPDYDPGTLDLFEKPVQTLHDIAENRDQFRAGTEKVINDLVEEYSGEITQRLRKELTEQLHAIMDDLDNKTEDN